MDIRDMAAVMLRLSLHQKKYNRPKVEGGMYGKPRTLEQPGGSVVTLFILRLELHANTIIPLIVKTLQ